MTELDEKKVEVITLRAELADNRVSKGNYFIASLSLIHTLSQEQGLGPPCQCG